MSKDFSCRTCGNLCTGGFDRDGKAIVYYQCGLGYNDPDNPDGFFCADHTDRETVKRIREGL